MPYGSGRAVTFVSKRSADLLCVTPVSIVAFMGVFVGGGRGWGHCALTISTLTYFPSSHRTSLGF
jgi:hypothetical protein